MASRTKRPSEEGGKTPKRPRQAASLTLSDLEQVKVLADPLRIRILEEMCREERTTKQVAKLLGEKPTKLYHHVEALERVGLIRLTRTQQNRGTTEKYYLGVARQFKADSRLFSAPEAARSDQSEMLQTMIGTMLERASEEMRNLIAESDGKDAIQEQGVFSHVEIRTDRKHGGKIRERLLTLLKSLEDPPAGGKKTAAKPTPARKPGGKSGEVAYRLTIAFYPIAPGE
ncbi:MAG: helix-turn-helix transcriptional regulator [Candidatus Eisenbacteria bacterium]|nr:helix-turn-helix transcriptional regulator [Candidatus Eisenbacteria bacterium]